MFEMSRISPAATYQVQSVKKKSAPPSEPGDNGKKFGRPQKANFRSHPRAAAFNPNIHDTVIMYFNEFNEAAFLRCGPPNRLPFSFTFRENERVQPGGLLISHTFTHPFRFFSPCLIRNRYIINHRGTCLRCFSPIVKSLLHPTGMPLKKMAESENLRVCPRSPRYRSEAPRKPFSGERNGKSKVSSELSKSDPGIIKGFAGRKALLLLPLQQRTLMRYRRAVHGIALGTARKIQFPPRF